MLFAALLIPELNSGEMVYAAVINMDYPLLAIVCRQSDDEPWEPVFAIRMGYDEYKSLPSCFNLHPGAHAALDELMKEERA